MIDAVPAQCARLLKESATNVALIPVIEYHRIPDISLISDVCVGSKTEVRSVVLVSKRPDIENIKSVALDESSRTSAALVKIIFREFLQRQPAWTTQTPNLSEMLENNDAALIIGDPAMTFSREGLHLWDMAALWRRHTGLGFVFAMWVVSNEAMQHAREVDFASARDEGVANIDTIVDYYLPRIPLSRQELTTYLTDNISYELDESMRKGLELYFNLAVKHQLIEKAREPSFV